METKKTDYSLYSLIAALVGLLLGFRIVGGILAMYFAGEAEKNNEDASLYNAGRIVGIIDIILGLGILLIVLFFLIMLGFFGWTLF